MNHQKKSFSWRCVFLFLIFLGISILIYQGCEQNDVNDEESFDYGANWCRVYTQDDVELALEKYESRHGQEDGDNLASFNIQDFGQIAVIEDDGSFWGDVNGIISSVRKFYTVHPDRFDFVSLYTNFSIGGMEDAFAWHIDVSQDIIGIGKNTHSSSEAFGSSGRLKGFELMNSIHRYRDGSCLRINLRGKIYMTFFWGGFPMDVCAQGLEFFFNFFVSPVEMIYPENFSNTFCRKTCKD